MIFVYFDVSVCELNLNFDFQNDQNGARFQQQLANLNLQIHTDNFKVKRA